MDIYREPVTAKALLIALTVLVVAQVGFTTWFVCMAYTWAGSLNWLLVALSCIYAIKYSLSSAAVAFVVALGGFALVEALRRRNRRDVI